MKFSSFLVRGVFCICVLSAASVVSAEELAEISSDNKSNFYLGAAIGWESLTARSKQQEVAAGGSTEYATTSFSRSGIANKGVFGYLNDSTSLLWGVELEVGTGFAEAKKNVAIESTEPFQASVKEQIHVGLLARLGHQFTDKFSATANLGLMRGWFRYTHQPLSTSQINTAAKAAAWGWVPSVRLSYNVTPQVTVFTDAAYYMYGTIKTNDLDPRATYLYQTKYQPKVFTLMVGCTFNLN